MLQKKWLERWASRAVDGRRRPRTILRLEALEERWCPATDIWIGAGGGNWGNYLNWSLGAVPGPFDDVVFNGAYSNGDCIFDGTGASSSQLCNSLTLTNGYSGTLHFQQYYPIGIGTGGIELDSGGIEQDNGADINCGGMFTTTGGELNNNSPLLANMNVAGVNISGAARETGDNLVLNQAGGASVINLPKATYTFNKNAGINILAGTLNWVDGSLKTTGTGIINIAANATLQKSTGTDAAPSTDLPIDNAGTFQLLAPALTITGADANGFSFTQTGGTCELQASAVFIVNNGLDIQGGLFTTDGRVATIDGGNATFEGGVINLNRNSQGGFFTGQLTCTKDVFIQGTAEFDAKIDDSKAPTADKITATNITLGGNSTLKAISVDLPAGGKVPPKSSWTILSASGNVNGNFNNFTLDFNDGSRGKYTATPGNPYTVSSP